MNDDLLTQFLDITESEHEPCIRAARALVRQELRRRRLAGERGGRPHLEETDQRRIWRERKQRQRDKTT